MKFKITWDILNNLYFNTNNSLHHDSSHFKNSYYIDNYLSSIGLSLTSMKKIKHLTKYIHRPITMRFPLSLWGDDEIVPFDPFLHVFLGVCRKLQPIGKKHQL